MSAEEMLAHHWRPIPPPPDWRALHGQPPADPKKNEAVLELREQMSKRQEWRSG